MVSVENSAPSWNNHAEPRLDDLLARSIREGDLAFAVGSIETERPHASSTDLPVPDGPTTPSISPRLHIEIETVMDGLLSKARNEAAHANGDLFAHQFISKNQSANSASNRMTMKMPCTTEVT